MLHSVFKVSNEELSLFAPKSPICWLLSKSFSHHNISENKSTPIIFGSLIPFISILISVRLLSSSVTKFIPTPFFKIAEAVTLLPIAFLVPFKDLY